MSTKINSKDIINKQIEKHKDSSWSKFLTEEFQKENFDTLLTGLITQFQEGIKFEPPMKSWFDDFSYTSLEDLNVVIIYKNRVENLNTDFHSSYDLANEGVLFYPLARTTTHLAEWRMFNMNFINHLMANKKDLVYVFIGEEASEFAGLLVGDTQNSKIFLPDLDHSFWTTDYAHGLISKNINNILIKNNKDAVEW